MRGKKVIFIAILAVVLIMLCAFKLDTNNGDKFTIFQSQQIAEGEIVTGDAICLFGNLNIKGEVNGDVVVVFGNIDIYGKAGGDVVAIFGNVDIHKGARVAGDTTGVFGNVTKNSEAIVQGEIADTKSESITKDFDMIPNMSFGLIMGMIIMYGFSCLAVVIVPDRIRLMVQSSKSTIGRHMGIGFLVMLVFILLIPILIITVVGIIPAFLLIIAFMIAALISSTAVYISLGQKIAAAVEGNNAVYIHLLIGLVIVNALGMIPLLGVLAALAVFFVGLGVAFDTRLGSPVLKKKAL